MRWSERAAELPLQPLGTLADRMPVLAGLLAASDEGLLIGVAALAGEAVLRHLANHAEERGGLLLGEVYASERAIASSRVVHITRAVAAQDSFGTGMSLRMSSAVWETARSCLRTGELVVGWYHSHPDLGAFFSATDRRTQHAFFPHAYSVGWVVDPLRRESQWFVGADCAPPAQVRYGLVDGACAAGGNGVAGATGGAAPTHGGAPTISTLWTK